MARGLDFYSMEERRLLAIEIGEPTRETRVYADFVWKDGQAVPDTVGMVVHPDDYIHDPLRNS